MIKLMYNNSHVCVCVCVVSEGIRNSLRGCKFQNFPGGGGMPPDPPSFSTLSHARISPLYE